MKTIQICLLVAIALGGNLLRAAITSYGGSHISPTSSIYQVSVRKAGDPTATSIYVHNYWDTNGTGSETNIKFLHYAHFGASQADFDAGVEVEITYFENIVSGDTRVSPLAYGITPAIVGGNKLKFTLHDTKKLFVAINLPLVASMGGQYKTRYLLMLMPELAEAVPSGSGVTTVTAAQGVSGVNAAIAAAPTNGTVVMASGTYTGQVAISRSNVTLYLAPGAYLKKNTTPPSNDEPQNFMALKIAAGNQNVTVKGRGVIEAWQQVIDVKDCTNITIEGVIIRATGREWTGRPNNMAAGLAFWPQRTNDSFFRNLKVLRYPPSPRTADAIDPASCHNVAITDCMVYSGDDGICFKQDQNPEILYDNLLENNVAFTPTSGFKYGNKLRLTVDGDVWRNNYSVYGQLQFSNAAADNDAVPTITNQVVENITVENSEHAFLSIGVVRYDTPYETDLDLVIDNLTVNKVWQTPPSYNTAEPNNPKINGYCGIYAKADPGKTINLTFNNLKVEGDYIHNMAELVAKMGGNQPFVGGRSVDTDWTKLHPSGAGTVNVFFNVFTQPPPTAPTNLTATAVSSSEINLTWQHPSTDETGFDVQRDLDASFTAPDLVTDSSTGPGSNLSYQSSGLSPGTTYFYRVRAYNGGGPSAYTPAVSATTDPIGGGGSPVVYDANALTIAASSGDATSAPADAGASNGNFFVYLSNAQNDFVSFTVNVATAGTYAVDVRYHKNAFRGIVQLSIDGADQGSATDCYIETANKGFATASLGTVSLAAGNRTFKFLATGKNTNSGDFQIGLDTITLTPQSGNTAPTIGDIADQTINANGNTGALAFTIGDAETAAGSLTLSGSSSNPTLVPSGNIVFGGSGASRTVTVTPATGQSGTSTITVTVSDGSLTAEDTFVMTVNPVVSVSATDAAAAEAALDPGTFTFTRVGSTAAALTVNFSVTGTATSGTDYTSLGTSVTFNAGSATATKTVAPIQDTTVEGAETVIATVTGGTGYAVGTPSSATVNLADDDSAVSDANALAIAASSGDSTTTPSDANASGGVFFVYLSNAPTGDFVSFTVNVPVTATYAVNVRYHKNAFRGIVQLNIDGNAQGSATDCYVPTANKGFVNVLLGNVSLTAGNHTFQFQVNDHNTNSSDYQIGLDTITLTP